MSGISDQQPKIAANLRKQLVRISETHAGQVHLHGRLFAQWLHYVFPQECPFPHKTGLFNAQTPTQFGDGYLVSEEEAGKHAAERRQQEENETDSDSDAQITQEAQWMSQWSEEEELMVDYT